MFGIFTIVLDFCFKTKGIEYSVISDLSKLTEGEQVALNYSTEEISAALTIKPHSVLFENEIRNKVRNCY